MVPGTILANRYRMLRRLGAGGMGEVYAAEHTEIPRRFAIKLLRSEFAGDPQMQARFRREAQAAAAVSSDHIVEVSDFGHADDGSLFLVMDLLEGADLRRILNRHGRLSAEQAAALTIQACAGVAAAHEAGVIHRDLKPENLFVAKHAGRVTVKVLDFGIAKLRHQTLGTSGGRLLGTPAYMPPEQIRGENVDHRVDVYALGAILYEALTGRLPHPGAAQHEIIAHALFEPVVPLGEINPDVPFEMAAITHKALAALASERIESATELAAGLAPFARDADLGALLDGDEGIEQPTRPARNSEPQGPAPVLARVAAASVRSGRPWRRAALALAALCLALVALWQLTRLGSAPTPTVRFEATAKIPVRAEEPVPAVSALPAPAPRAVEPAQPAAPTEQPATPKRPRAGLRPRAAREGVVATEPAAAGSQVIEVRRGERTIVFKRDNPFRQ